VHTPLLPVHDSRAQTGPRSAQFHIPRSTLPAFLAFKVYIAEPEGPYFKRLMHGSFASLPLGVGVGAPAPLGAAVVSQQSGEPEEPVAVNFAVTSRHACALPVRPPQGRMEVAGTARGIHGLATIWM
jgi:hypothetical protein